MRVPSSWLPMNVRAASWATTRRFGETSVEHIERDTSIASSTDVRAAGHRHVGGRAPGGEPERRRWRRRGGPAGPAASSGARGGTAARTTATLETRTAMRRRRRPTQPEHGQQGRAGGERDQRPRPRERHQTTRPNQRSISPPPAISRATAARAKSAVISVVSSTEVTRRSSDVGHRLDARRRVGRRVGPAGDGHQVAQALLVERRRHLVAVDGDRRAVGGADPDRRHVDAGVGGELRRRRSGPVRRSPRRRTPAGSTPTGSSRGSAGPARPGRAARPACRRWCSSRRAAPDPTTCRPPVFSRSIAAQHLGMLGRRLLGDQRPGAEGDEPDVDRRRLGGDEAPGDVLGDGEAGRLDVVGAHAVGHVDDDQHGAAGTRAGERRLAGATGRRSSRPARRAAARTGRGAARPSRRHPPAASKPDAASAVGAAGPPALEHDVGRDEHGHQHQRGQQGRPDERHRRGCFERRTMSTRAATRSSSVAMSCRRTPAAAHRLLQGAARGRRPRRGSGAGTRGRWCRRRPARRSRRPRRRSGRPRAAPARADRPAAPRRPRGGGRAVTAGAPTRRR